MMRWIRGLTTNGRLHATSIGPHTERDTPSETVGARKPGVPILRGRSVSVRLAVLTVSVLAAYALLVPLAFHLGGKFLLVAAASAAALCLAGSAAGLIVIDRLHGPVGALAGMCLAMLFRAVIPFSVGLAIHLRGGLLAQAGLLWYLVVFYLVTLAVGTFLSLPATKAPARTREDKREE
jgi:hypothetical protein